MKQKWIFTGIMAAAMAFMPMGADAASSNAANATPDYSVNIRTFDVNAASTQRLKGLIPNANVKISADEAMRIALSKVPGASVTDIHKFKLEFDDGRWQYEGEIRYNNMEYEFAIDANTGAILEWEAEPLHH